MRPPFRLRCRATDGDGVRAWLLYKPWAAPTLDAGPPRGENDVDYNEPDLLQFAALAAPSSRNVLVICWQRRSLVAFGAVAGLILAVLFYIQKPAVYQSVAQVLVIKKSSDALPVAGGDPRLSYYEDYVSTHLVLITSPLVVERAVKKHDLGR